MQKTDLNVAPYYDDFDVTDNFHRVLFRPGFAVQARELTTLQSILQNQIERLSDHVFEQGAMVIPGDIGYDLNYYAVKLTSFTDSASVGVTLNDFIGLTLTGASSGVKARVVNVVATDGTDPNTLFVKYLNSGTNNTTTAFSAETISVATTLQSTSTTVSAVVSATATGSAASVKEGVYYINGYHVKVSDQNLILDKYTNTPSYRVGLTVAESFVTQNDDPTLNDNAQGVSNTNAPGAHRFKIDLTLTKKSLAATDDANFVELLRLKNGIVQNQVRTTEYAILEDTLARRTFDESGDYAVKDFDIDLREHLISGTNRGIYSSSDGGLESKIAAGMESGKAYVKGYEIETLSTTTVDVPKPRTTQKITNESLPFSVGRQVELNHVSGSPPIGIGTDSHVNLFNKRTTTVGTGNGTQVGVARVYDMKLKNVGYADSSTIFESSLYDVQTFTYLQLNTSTTVPLPAYIEGQNSNAVGFAYTSSNNSNQITLYQVNGQFQVGEEIFVNGVTASRSITEVEDYGMEDVKQLVGNDPTNYKFSADPILSLGHLIAPMATQYTISAKSGAASTITSPSANFANIGIKTGDIIQYSVAGNTVPTYNSVTAKTSTSISLEAISDVTNVCSGALPAADTTVNDLFKVTLEVKNNSKAFLFSDLTKNNVASVDTNGADLIIKKSYNVTVASNAFSGTLETDSDLTLEPFDEEDYNLTFKTSGAVEPLTNQKLTVSGRTVTLSGLDTASGAAVLTVTWKKVNVKPKSKIFKRATTYTVNKSSKTQSGTGLMKLND